LCRGEKGWKEPPKRSSKKTSRQTQVRGKERGPRGKDREVEKNRERKGHLNCPIPDTVEKAHKERKKNQGMEYWEKNVERPLTGENQKSL